MNERLLIATAFALTGLTGCFSPPVQDPNWSERLQATAATLEGCRHIGDDNRYGVRAEVADLCATLVLVDQAAATGPTPEGLTLPAHLGIESHSLVRGSCVGRAWRGLHELNRPPQGIVAATPDMPSHLDVDVRFETALDQPQWVRLTGAVDLDGAPSCF